MLITREVVEDRVGRATRMPGPFSVDELMAAKSPWELQKTTVTNDAIGFAISGRTIYRNKGPEPLYRFLQQSHIRASMHVLNCKNPRDKIWGMAGIARDMDELGLKVGHTKSVQEV